MISLNHERADNAQREGYEGGGSRHAFELKIDALKAPAGAAKLVIHVALWDGSTERSDGLEINDAPHVVSRASKRSKAVIEIDADALLLGLTKEISVNVKGDKWTEADEIFGLKITDVSFQTEGGRVVGAAPTLKKGFDFGIIQNDDPTSEAERRDNQKEAARDEREAREDLDDLPFGGDEKDKEKAKEDLLYVLKDLQDGVYGNENFDEERKVLERLRREAEQDEAFYFNDASDSTHAVDESMGMHILAEDSPANDMPAEDTPPESLAASDAFGDGAVFEDIAAEDAFYLV